MTNEQLRKLEVVVAQDFHAEYATTVGELIYDIRQVQQRYKDLLEKHPDSFITRETIRKAFKGTVCE